MYNKSKIFKQSALYAFLLGFAWQVQIINVPRYTMYDYVVSK